MAEAHEVGPTDEAQDAPPARPDLDEAADLVAAIDEHEDEQQRRADEAQGPASTAALARARLLPGEHDADGHQHVPEVRRERRVRPGSIGSDHQDADDEQRERARQDVAPDGAQRLAAPHPPPERERDRHPDDEQKGREHDVGDGHAVAAARGVHQESRGAAHARHLVDEQHQQHVEAAQQVDRQDARAGRRGRLRDRLLPRQGRHSVTFSSPAPVRDASPSLPRITLTEALGRSKTVPSAAVTVDSDGGPSGSAKPSGPLACHRYWPEPKVIDGRRPGEEAVRSGPSVVEDDAHRMRVVLVLVDDEQRPLSVGAVHRVGRHQDVTGGIEDVARGRKDAVLAVAGLHPLPGQHPAGEVLRGRLQDLVAVSTVNMPKVPYESLQPPCRVPGR